MKTKLFFILFLLFYSTTLATLLMDGSLNMFYIQHYHPFKYIDGNNRLGRIIVQNNSQNGFSVEIESSNNGKLINQNGETISLDIDYQLNFEEGSGRVGNGIISDFSSSELITPHILFYGLAPSTSTDTATTLMLTLENYDERLMMAGHYRDTVTVTYTNY